MQSQKILIAVWHSADGGREVKKEFKANLSYTERGQPRLDETFLKAKVYNLPICFVFLFN